MIEISDFKSLIFSKMLMEGLNFEIKRPIVFFDLETTGTSTVTDKIVELCAVKYFPDNREPEIKTIKVNPLRPIPKEASDVHGIKDCDVKGLPSFSKYAKAIHAYFKDCDLGGYNHKSFDIPLLFTEFASAGITELWDFKIIDPLQTWRDKEPRTLTGAMQYFCGEELEGAHGAEVDVLATVKIAITQIDAFDLETPFSEIDTIDLDGKLIMTDGNPCYNFGKNKGNPVLSDSGYIDWMLKSDTFHWNTKECLRKIRSGEIK